MSPEKQRIAIAMACGHTFEWQGDTGSLWVVAPNRLILDVRFPNKHSREETLNDSGQSLPDYLNDLNAMHLAESVLTYDQTETYQNGLANMVRGQPFEGYCHWSDIGSVFVAHASAPQRAEAFLKTLSLWTED